MRPHRRIRSFLLAGLLTLPNNSVAAAIVVPLPEVEGTYEVVGDTRTANFDLGARFSSIEKVTLRLELEGVDSFSPPFTAFNIGIRDERVPSDPPPAFGRINFRGFLSSGLKDLKAEFLFASGSEINSDNFADWRRFLVDPYQFDVIGDGTGSVSIQLASRMGTIVSAELLIQGTIVPEPSTVVFLCLGIIGLAALRSKRRA